ncbi:MAG TPA: HIT domain-containing protein [Ktedonobacterales bacterium]|nr:HIT domain-containing protein [Ktedonobacterales bacterium]
MTSQTSSAPNCAFCDRDALDLILDETEHFYLLADHAPLVEGHALIIPREHYACYGAIPEALEQEFLELKRRVAAFLAAAYTAPAFFEHGVFRQTVRHAHLHALPFGALPFDPHLAAGNGARLVAAPADLRRWYAERGHYFYLEQPGSDSRFGLAAVFPPEEERYWQVLAHLRDAAGRHGTWMPQAARRATGQEKMRTLAEKWRAYVDGVR